jgi:phage terminase large subunit
MLQYKVTTSPLFETIRSRTERVVILEGSARSTKTYSVLQYLIYLAVENENAKKPRHLRIAIVRSHLTWIRSTVLVDFKNILRDQFGLWNEASMNKTNLVYSLGKTEFVFTGLDKEEGQKFHGAKNDYVFLNEAIELNWPSVQQLLFRMPGRMLVDYNPNMDSRHWIETKLKKRPDACVIHSTFRDNPFLEDDLVQELERLEPTPENIERGTADEAQWKIYGLGVRAQIKGLVYPNWDMVPTMPKAEEYFYGIDWGFSVDPTALVQAAFVNGELYVQELLYERGLTNIENPSNTEQPSIERRLGELNVSRKFLICADSAEPKSIQDISNCGYNIVGVKKGPNSILNGISIVKRYKLHIVEPSPNLVTEITRYKWVEDKNGESQPMPVDNFNHLLDAVRMLAMHTDQVASRGGYAYDSCKMRTGLVPY